MGEFKKGDFVRCIDESDTSVVKLDGVYKVDEVSGRYVYVVVDADPRGMLMNRFEPWQPRVGERVTAKDTSPVNVEVHWNKHFRRSYGNIIDGSLVVTSVIGGIGKSNIGLSNKLGNSLFYMQDSWLKPADPVVAATTTPEQTTTLKIEAGKFYKTSDGRKVGPMRVWRLGGWASEGEFSTGLWLSDGQPKYSMAKDSPALIAEWIDEPVAKAEASNDNAQPKFKVGDAVKHPEGQWSRYYPVTKIENGKFWIEVLGKPFHFSYDVDAYDWLVENSTSTPTPTTTIIVALIENGQPKPSSTPHVHATTGAAEKEAKRLAAKFKGKQFGVFTLTTTHEEATSVYDHKWQNLAVLGLNIDAIKELRSITGMGLKPAKDAVEYFLDAA